MNIGKIVFAAFLSAGCDPLLARDLGQWGNVDPATREWFKSLHNEYGTSCCDLTDGSRVDGVDYVENADGTYDVYYDNDWHHVVKERILRGTNKVGYAIIWRLRGAEEPYCFLPGARG